MPPRKSSCAFVVTDEGRYYLLCHELAKAANVPIEEQMNTLRSNAEKELEEQASIVIDRAKQIARIRAALREARK